MNETDRQQFLDQLGIWQKRMLRAWAIWAVVYAAGFGLLWVLAPGRGWLFLAWAIGWALFKGALDHRESRRLLEKARHSAGSDNSAPSANSQSRKS